MRLLTMVAAFFSAISEGLAHAFRDGAGSSGCCQCMRGPWLAVLLVPIFAFIPMGFYELELPLLPAARLEPALVRRISELAGCGSRAHSPLVSRSGIATGCITLAIAAPGGFSRFARSKQPRRGRRLFLLFMDADDRAVDRDRRRPVLPVCATLVGGKTDLGIVIGHTVTSIPVAFVILLATLKKLRTGAWEQAAATLGAKPVAHFRQGDNSIAQSRGWPPPSSLRSCTRSKS